MGAIVAVGALLITSVVAADDGKKSDIGNHTLRWDTNNPSGSRFVMAFPGAVLDKNTGLVWEQAPDATQRNWSAAVRYCLNRTVGGTVGWRLPSVVELKSVQDPSLLQSKVPTSVFTGILSDFYYWSATTIATPTGTTFPLNAWVVRFDSGSVEEGDKSIVTIQVWCVRGPMQESVY